MTRQMFRRLVLVGTLAVLLSVAGTGAAQARDLRSMDSTWGWLEKIWTKGMAVLWSWREAPSSEPNHRSKGGLQKQGHGVDPDGATTANPLCTVCTDQGNGLDPNG